MKRIWKHRYGDGRIDTAKRTVGYGICAHCREAGLGQVRAHNKMHCWDKRLYPGKCCDEFYLCDSHLCQYELSHGITPEVTQ
jgi:hypothetical protein